MDRGGGPARGLTAFTVGPAREGSLDDALSGAGRPIMALDMRRLPASGEVADWFWTRRPARTLGAVFDDSLAAAGMNLT